ncbi:MAG: hypothetical protein U0556_05740 [Dehalococcoidia bacterium]
MARNRGAFLRLLAPQAAGYISRTTAVNGEIGGISRIAPVRHIAGEQ